jgi:hypothetical protein
VVREPGSHEVTVFFLQSSKRVLWIEADMKFVDILLNFLLLPVGAAVQALSRQGRAPVPPGYGDVVLCFTFITGNGWLFARNQSNSTTVHRESREFTMSGCNI